MKKATKILCLILCALTVTLSVSCAQTADNGQTTTAPSSSEETTTYTTLDVTTAPAPVEIPENIKNLIIIIGDGMGPIHITSGEMAQSKDYDFTTWTDSRCNTDSIDKKGNRVLTDSAASATALATGTLTINGYVGVDKNQKELTTIMDIAKEMGKSVGIVTSDQIYGATPAGFSGHSSDRNNSTKITLSQITSKVDLLCGLRNDKYYADFLGLFEKHGYHYATSFKNKDEIMGSEKVFLPVDIENGKSGEVALKDAAALAIEFLERDEDGFVLMIEQAYIDKCSHSNDIDGMLARMKSIDETVDTVTKWIGDRKDTAVIVTADHETGGLRASSTTKYKNQYTKGADDFYYEWTSTGHTQTEVKIFVYGYDVDYKAISEYRKNDMIKNTDVFKLMKQILDENK